MKIDEAIAEFNLRISELGRIIPDWVSAQPKLTKVAKLVSELPATCKPRITDWPDVDNLLGAAKEQDAALILRIENALRVAEDLDWDDDRVAEVTALLEAYRALWLRKRVPRGRRSRTLYVPTGIFDGDGEVLYRKVIDEA